MKGGKPLYCNSGERYVPERLASCWQMVEEIAQHPGHSRRELADQFNLSERQTQSDLNLIREVFHLPLVRRQGYRFDDERRAYLSSADVELLIVLLDSALSNPSLLWGVPQLQVQSLRQAIPSVVAPHARPLLQVVMGAHGRLAPMFTRLARAILGRTCVRLRFQQGVRARDTEVVRPSAIVPCGDEWVLLAKDALSARAKALPLKYVEAVET